MELWNVFSTLAFVLVFVLLPSTSALGSTLWDLKNLGFFSPFVQQNSGLKISLQKFLEDAMGKSGIRGASEYFCGNCSILNEIMKYLLNCCP